MRLNWLSNDCAILEKFFMIFFFKICKDIVSGLKILILGKRDV